MSRSLRLYVAATCAAGVAALVLFPQAVGAPAESRVGLALALALLLALSERFPTQIALRDRTELYHCEETVLVVMALLLDPAQAFAAFMLGLALGQVGARPPVKAAFNIAQFAVASALSLGVINAAGELGPPSSSDVALVVAGGAVFYIVNHLFMSGVLALAEGHRFRRLVRVEIGFSLMLWLGNVLTGTIAGLVAVDRLWALPIAAAPGVMLQAAFRAHVRARGDRERLRGLLDSTIEAYSSVAVDRVERSLEASVRSLLRCRAARLGSEPPAAGELGVRFPSRARAARWLVAADKLDGEPFGADDRQVLAAVAAVGAGALENAHLVEETRHRALHDALTGLPNSTLFEDRVGQSLVAAQRDGGVVAVVFLDVDSFKKVNDSLGHSAGNALLVQVAARLRASVRTSDTVARLGGDEFTILLPRAGSVTSALMVAEHVVARLREPFTVGGQKLFMTASAGVAVTPLGGDRAESLLKNADSAMYRAKMRGRNRVQLYSQEMNALAQSRLSLESELHAALARGELVVHYQPQVTVATGDVIGVEALVRWNHPRLGLLGPDEFIPLAEQSGLVVEIDGFVLERALRQLRSWIEDGHAPVRMAVNMSGRSLADHQTSERVLGALRFTSVDPRLLEIEVTETVALAEDSEALSTLTALRAHGVGVTIDDFGTRYSVLGRLRQFPVSRLKIDRSFVAEIGAQPSSGPIVAAIVSMAHALGLPVVAEGVENDEQMGYLRGQRCDEAQGWLFGRPVGAAEIAGFLARDVPAAAHALR